MARIASCLFRAANKCANGCTNIITLCPVGDEATLCHSRLGQARLGDPLLLQRLDMGQRLMLTNPRHGQAKLSIIDDARCEHRDNGDKWSDTTKRESVSIFARWLARSLNLAQHEMTIKLCATAKETGEKKVLLILLVCTR